MAARIGWLLAGAMIVFGVLGAASIGLPFLALGAALFALLARQAARRGGGIDAGPVLAGASFVLMAVGVLNLGLTLGTVLLGLGAGTFAVGRVVCHREAT